MWRCKQRSESVSRSDASSESELSEHLLETEESFSEFTCHSESEDENIEDLLVKKCATVLLKLEVSSHVSTCAIDELLEELHFILSSAVVPTSNTLAADIFRKHNLQINQSIINKLSATLSSCNPLVKAIAKGGPLATTFNCKQYYKDYFKVVEPVEYFLDTRKKKKTTFQYIPNTNISATAAQHKRHT